MERQFEVVDDGIVSVVNLSREDYSEMVSSMFKIMICGISNEVPKIVKNKKMRKLAIYRKLKEEMFEDTEYRLSLWLPLTL